MKKKSIIFTLAWILLSFAAMAQDKETMSNYQSELQQLFEQVYTAPSDNQRYHANESALQLLTEALAVDNSFRWQWDFGTRVSVLTSPDKKFRIFTWPVVNDAGEFECFGIVQALNEQTKDYNVVLLNDRSADIVNRQEEVLSPDRWFGTVYQELIVTHHENRTYYTLLGWCDSPIRAKPLPQRIQPPSRSPRIHTRRHGNPPLRGTIPSPHRTRPPQA